MISKSLAGALLTLALAAGFALGVAADRWLAPTPTMRKPNRPSRPVVHGNLD